MVVDPARWGRHVMSAGPLDSAQGAVRSQRRFGTTPTPSHQPSDTLFSSQRPPLRLEDPMSSTRSVTFVVHTAMVLIVVTASIWAPSRGEAQEPLLADTAASHWLGRPAVATPAVALRPVHALAAQCQVPGAPRSPAEAAVSARKGRGEEVRPNGVAGAPGDVTPDPWAVATAQALALSPPDRAPDALVAALDSLGEALATLPGAGTLWGYREAMLLGARIETMDGRARIEAAKELHALLGEILGHDPEHAGAHHLLGRLNAAVMRLGGAKRLLVRIVAGGELLAAASWEDARAQLEHAERHAPCMAEHHLELARLLADTGDSEGARREAVHVLSLVSGTDVHGGEGHGAVARGEHARAQVLRTSALAVLEGSGT